MARTTKDLSHSSALSSVSYDDEDQILEVTFNSGQSYTFSQVPQDIFEGLVGSPSPGRFYHSVIKGNY